MRGIVMDIDHFAVHDGQGVRTCAYLKGCPLNCPWCHSPESQSLEPEIVYVAARCVFCGACANICESGAHAVADGLHEQDRGKCSQCLACADVCPSNALSVCGREMDAADVARELIEDAVFFKHSGGGVTITGGEALMQPEFTLEIARSVAEAGIHFIIETSGCGDVGALQALAKLGAAFYYDIKLMDDAAHREYCGAGNDLILRNLAALRETTDAITLRVPLIPGITDTMENIDAVYALALELNIIDVHLLPYNASAPAKYEWLGRTYPLAELAPQSAEALDALLARAPDALSVSVIT